MSEAKGKYDYSLVVEKAFAHFCGDRKVGIWPHTITINGLDFRRDFFADDEQGDVEFKDSLNTFSQKLKEALEALHGEVYHVSFDYEEKQKFMVE